MPGPSLELLDLPSELLEEIAIRLSSLHDYRQLMVSQKARLLPLLRDPNLVKRNRLEAHGGQPGPAFLAAFARLYSCECCTSLSVNETHAQCQECVAWTRVVDAFLHTPGLFQLPTIRVRTMQRVLEQAPPKQHASPEKLHALVHTKLAILQQCLQQTAHRYPVQALVQSAFRQAIAFAELPLLRYLLETQRDALGSTLDHRWIMRSLGDGHAEIALLFLQQGFSVAREHLVSAAQMVTQLAHMPTLQLFFERVQAEQSSPELDACVRTSWGVCAYEGNANVARFLLDRYHVSPSADQNAGVKWSCRRGYTQLLRVLTDFGLQLTQIEQETQLYTAIRNGHAGVVEILVREHCATAAIHSQQESPLREAARLGSLDMVRVLVEVGQAQIRACHYDAIRLAKQGGFMDVHAYLVEQAQLQQDQQDHKEGLGATPKSSYRRFIDETGVSNAIQGISIRTWL